MYYLWCMTKEELITQLENLAAHSRDAAKCAQNLLNLLESNDDDLPSDWDFDQSGDRINDKFE